MTVTGFLYKLARASATGRAMRKGPAALARRSVRRRVYRKVNGATARALNKALK